MAGSSYDILYRGTITALANEGAYVEIPGLGIGVQFGPCEVPAFSLSPGDSVLVGQVNGISEDLVIVTPIFDAFQGIQIRVFDNAAQRDTAIPTPVEPSFVWLRDDDSLYSYYGGAWHSGGAGYTASNGVTLVGNDMQLSVPVTVARGGTGATDAATARTNLDVQQHDTDLDALAGQSGTGLLARTGTGTAATRTITSTGGTIAITNPGGVAGNINLELVLNAIYPVGSIYMSTANTNPGTLFGGTWTAFGAGRMPIGVAAGGDSRWDTAEETGGTEIITDAMLPTHTHTLGGSTSAGTSHSHGLGTVSAANEGEDHAHGINPINLSQTTVVSTNINDGSLAVAHGAATGRANINATVNSATGGRSAAHTHGLTGSLASESAHTHPLPSNTGAKDGSAGAAFRPPYISVYMWKRTA